MEIEDRIADHALEMSNSFSLISKRSFGLYFFGRFRVDSLLTTLRLHILGACHLRKKTCCHAH